MASTVISDEKVEQYKTALKRTYWELHEAAHFLFGNTEFALRCNLDPNSAEFFHTANFGLIPCSWEASNQDAYDQILEKIYTAIQNEEIWVYSYRFCKAISIEGSFAKKHPYLNKHTYFLHPDDALAIAITEGIQLPFELQIASSLYQTKKPTEAKKGGWKNETKREALAQIYWYENPGGSIQEFVRQAYQLKAESQKKYGSCTITRSVGGILYKSTKKGKFEFINGNGENTPKNRGRIVKNIKCSNELIPPIPGIIVRKDEYVAFDFKNLKVVLETIKDHLCFKNPAITSEELLSYPLIQIYFQAGGAPLNKIIEFSLRHTLEDMFLYENSPSNI
ncbi:MAG: hypothetical protein H0X29_04910 [Parachlamydiaceae bacterium]|nr:hypothetical protein [Parachlamydiaceae bacterium]